MGAKLTPCMEVSFHMWFQTVKNVNAQQILTKPCFFLIYMTILLRLDAMKQAVVV